MASSDRKAHVTFRTQLLTSPQSVHVLGSWNNYLRGTALEQDLRVGRDIWKCSVQLDMGSEYTYYFLLDGSRALPEQLLFVPEELRISSPTTTPSSVLFDDAAFQHPRSPPKPSSPASFREKLRLKTHSHKWSMSSKKQPPIPQQQQPTNEDLRSVAGYLRSTHPPPPPAAQLFYSPLSPAPSLCHSTASSGIDWLPEPEPVMRYYNFDEVGKGEEGGVPLGCLREQVDDEMRWRREWGYLGGVVM